MIFFCIILSISLSFFASLTIYLMTYFGYDEKKRRLKGIQKEALTSAVSIFFSYFVLSFIFIYLMMYLLNRALFLKID